MIAFTIREVTHLKILHTIISKFAHRGIPYIILHYDMPRGDKEYNRATIKRLKLSSPREINYAKKVLSYKNDAHLLSLLVKNKCECNWGLGFLGLILVAAGLYFVVWGFISQTTTALSGALNWTAALYYLIGVALMGFGKMSKRSSCSDCKVHMKH